MDKRILDAALWVWQCPVSGNALVVLRAADSRFVISTQTPYVVFADLDVGCERSFFLDELSGKIRRAEEDDYGYSWTCNADDDIVDYVMANA